MNSLLHTKKMFVDTYGEVPPMIGFLGIDTDSGAYKKSLESKTGKEITLSPNEQLPILVSEARPIYDVNKEAFSWIPEENLYALTSMTLGAGQVRTNGRFAFTVNQVKVAQKVREILNNITNARIINNDTYELLSSNIEIHMVFSICGGTGCGIFLNMAYLLKQEAPKCKLTGYAILPDIFKSMAHSGMAKVAPNAYGAIQDLDYLMHMNIGSNPVKLESINSSYDIRERPFNSVMFIDNKNNNNDTYTHIDELAEMTSLALVTAAGELSSASASVSDNLDKNISEGSMDIENKKAWAAGLGVCEILYKGTELSEIYAIKAGKLVIERLLNACVDTEIIVNTWIDSADVRIRENNGFDQVTDFIYDKTPKYDFTQINDCGNAQPEVDQYLNMVKAKDDVVNARIGELSSRVKVQLLELLTENINKECGVATAENIIYGIQAQINIFLSEMKEEKDVLTENEPRLKSAVEIAIADLSKYDGRFFKLKSKLEEMSDEVMMVTRDLAVCRLEIVRRTAAITFYNSLQQQLLNHLDFIKNIKNALKAVLSKFTTDLAKIQNRVGRISQTFQIDLAQSSVSTIVVKPEEVQIPDFVRGITLEGKIFGFGTVDSIEIEKVLLKYTRTLNSAINWSATSIDDILNSMSEEAFARMVRLATDKAMPLFRYDYRGYTPKESPRDGYYIGVPDKVNNRLFKDGYFKNMQHGTADVDFASIGLKDRIIIYRQVGVVPAYAIAPITNYYHEYADCRTNCHIDSNLKTRMDREEFNLFPKKANDDDLLDLWVKGFMFGLIKNEENTYYFKSAELGDILEDNWVLLGKYRDEAFDQFRRNKTVVRREFNAYIEDQENKQGADAMKTLMESVKAAYLDKYSQINMSKDQIKTKGYEKIRELITSELNYVKDM